MSDTGAHLTPRTGPIPVPPKTGPIPLVGSESGTSRPRSIRRGWTRWLLRRLGLAILTLWVVSLIVFFATSALGDPVRLRLYLAVAHEAGGGEICVCDIPDVGVSQSTVSHHLRKLREAGLLHSRRVGTWVYYRAAADGSGALAVLGLVGRAPGVPSRPEG